MPQVDLETLVSVCAGGGADRKIACETLADLDGDGEDRRKDDAVEAGDPPPDFPPESFWLSKDAEFDWLNRNAFLDRKDSTKRNSNSMNPNVGLNSVSNSSSQRFSANRKSKATMIGLPKTQKTSYVDTTKYKSCNKPPNIRLFPKRPESVGKAPMAEPTSPKVSCMGRVRSKRGRRKSSEPAPAKQAEMERSVDRKWTGICRRLMGIFQSGRGRKHAVQTRRPPPTLDSPPRRSVTIKSREFPPNGEMEAAEPPGLGGMMRFSSGRRSTSLVADADMITDTDVSSMKR
ncbi:Calcium/calmodulin-dependent protein kinase [Bertholletia excelsa]